jgi:hypothetical protein
MKYKTISKTHVFMSEIQVGTDFPDNPDPKVIQVMPVKMADDQPDRQET